MLDLAKIVAKMAGTISPRIDSSENVVEAIKTSLEDQEERSYVSRRFSPGGYVCARFKAGQRLTDFKIQMAPNEMKSLLLFKAGTGAHDILQNSVLPQTGRLFGNWRCAYCHKLVKHQTIPKMICSRECSVELKKAKVDAMWKYEELYFKESPLDDDLYEVSGFLDGIWLLEDGKWATLEGKTCDDLAFRGLRQVKSKEVEGGFVLKPTDSILPRHNHVNQGLVYCTLAKKAAERGELPLDPAKCIGTIILYINRNDFQPKEFSVAYSGHAYRELVNLAKATKSAVDQGNALLAPPHCSSRSSMLAKQCPMVDECFPKKVRKKKTSKKKSDE